MTKVGVLAKEFLAPVEAKYVDKCTYHCDNEYANEGWLENNRAKGDLDFRKSFDEAEAENFM